MSSCLEKKPSRLEILFSLLEEEKNFRKEQIRRAIFHSPFLRYSQITTLSKKIREKIISSLGEEILTLQVAKTQKVDQATKYLFMLSGQQRIETVHMQFKNAHTSLCISSQVGCLCKCAFCTTGHIPFQRNLTVDELIDQSLFFFKHQLPLRNIAFMGMGEPFLNPHLFDALHLFTNPQYMGISERRLTLSTVGIPEGIMRLTQHYPQISLTLSLHSPFNEERSELIALNKTYPLELLFDLLEDHILKTHKKTYLAYLVITGKNDTLEHVKKLTHWISRKKLQHLYHVNLIRYNPSFSETSFAPTKKSSLFSFKNQLEQRNIHVTIRQSFGSEIGAACGQLSAEYEKDKSSFSSEKFC